MNPLERKSPAIGHDQRGSETVRFGNSPVVDITAGRV